MGSKNTAAVYKHVKDTDKHEQAILAALAHWAHDDPPRICWHSINQIANATHYSRNGVIELTGRLEMLGYITKRAGGIDRHGVKNSNVYTFILPQDVKRAKGDVDKSVDKPVDNSASAEDMVNPVDQGGAPGGPLGSAPGGPQKKYIKETKKQPEAAVVRADEVWRGKEVPEGMEQRILEREARLIGRGSKGSRLPSPEPKTPLTRAASACGMARFERDVAKEFTHVMLRRDLNECLAVIAKFDEDRREGRLKEVRILPKELLNRLSMLPVLPGSPFRWIGRRTGRHV